MMNQTMPRQKVVDDSELDYAMKRLNAAIKTNRYEQNGWAALKKHHSGLSSLEGADREHAMAQIRIMLKLWNSGQNGKMAVSGIMDRCASSGDSLANLGLYAKGAEIKDARGKLLAQVGQTSPIVLWIRKYRLQKGLPLEIENAANLVPIKKQLKTDSMGATSQSNGQMRKIISDKYDKAGAEAYEMIKNNGANGLSIAEIAKKTSMDAGKVGQIAQLVETAHASGLKMEEQRAVNSPYLETLDKIKFTKEGEDAVRGILLAKEIKTKGLDLQSEWREYKKFVNGEYSGLGKETRDKYDLPIANVAPEIAIRRAQLEHTSKFASYIELRSYGDAAKGFMLGDLGRE